MSARIHAAALAAVLVVPSARAELRAASPASPTSPACAPAPSLTPSAASRFAGRYRWVGGDAEIRALDDAIESVVRQMNFLIRPLARARLRKPNLPSEEIVLSVASDTITVARPGRPTVSAPADGSAIEWHAPDGDRFEVRHGVADGGLYQKFRDERSDTLNRFTLDEDGRRLTVETTTTARRLPAPLRFRTTYERTR